MLESDISKIDEIANKFMCLEEKIDKAKEESEIVNRREGILKWKISDYNEIEKIKKLFAPYSKVWILGRDYNYKVFLVYNYFVRFHKQ
jgi:dynein heavy chain